MDRRALARRLPRALRRARHAATSTRRSPSASWRSVIARARPADRDGAGPRLLAGRAAPVGAPQRDALLLEPAADRRLRRRLARLRRQRACSPSSRRASRRWSPCSGATGIRTPSTRSRGSRASRSWSRGSGRDYQPAGELGNFVLFRRAPREFFADAAPAGELFRPVGSSNVPTWPTTAAPPPPRARPRRRDARARRGHRQRDGRAGPPGHRSPAAAGLERPARGDDRRLPRILVGDAEDRHRALAERRRGAEPGAGRRPAAAVHAIRERPLRHRRHVARAARRERRRCCSTFTAAALPSARSGRTALLVGALARAARARTFAAEYRLGPEHTAPAAHEDALAAYRHLLGEGIAPQDIVLAGDSAGGTLVLGTLIALRDAGEPMPAAGIAISPWVDLSCSGASFQTNARYDFVGERHCRLAAASYLGAVDPRSPTVSPLFADLRGLAAAARSRRAAPRSWSIRSAPSPRARRRPASTSACRSTTTWCTSGT